jgi:WD40 repeat protein
VWDAQTGRQITQVAAAGQATSSVQFTHDGARIVTASGQGFVEMWDARSGARAGPAFACPGQAPCEARIDPTGRRMAVTSESTATLFDAVSGRKIADLERSRIESQRAAPAVFSPSGDVLMTIGPMVQLWDAKTGELVVNLRERSPAATARFTEDGSRVLTTHRDGFRFWDAKTGQPESRLVPGRAFGGFLAVASDGQRAVAIDNDGYLRAWDFPRGTRQDGESIASLAELLVGYKSNARGAVEPIDAWDTLLRKERGAGARDALRAWALADRDTRPIGPSTTVTRDEYIRGQLAAGSREALREARRLFPWDPRVSDKGATR